MDFPFEVEILKTNQPVECPPRMIQLVPTKLFVLPQGTVENKTSFALFLSTKTEPVVLAQLSAKMLLEAMSTPLLQEMRKTIADEIVKRVREENRPNL